MVKVTLTVHGGHFATGEALRTRVDPALRAAVSRAGLIVQAGIQRSTPVRTGALRRSWTTAPPAWQGTVLRTDVGTNLPYAHYQDTKTGNKGYIERGVDSAKTDAVQALTAGMQAAAQAAWVKS